MLNVSQNGSAFRTEGSLIGFQSLQSNLHLESPTALIFTRHLQSFNSSSSIHQFTNIFWGRWIQTSLVPQKLLLTLFGWVWSLPVLYFMLKFLKRTFKKWLKYRQQCFNLNSKIYCHKKRLVVKRLDTSFHPGCHGDVPPGWPSTFTSSWQSDWTSSPCPSWQSWAQGGQRAGCGFWPPGPPLLSGRPPPRPGSSAGARPGIKHTNVTKGRAFVSRSEEQTRSLRCSRSSKPQTSSADVYPYKQTLTGYTMAEWESHFPDIYVILKCGIKVSYSYYLSYQINIMFLFRALSYRNKLNRNSTRQHEQIFHTEPVGATGSVRGLFL